MQIKSDENLVEKMIDESDFSGWVEFPYDFLDTIGGGWILVKDQYGRRGIPLIRKDVWNWLKHEVFGTYVLEANVPNSDRRISFASPDRIDRILFSDINDLIMFKLRWIG
jgi:hypothetical protein